MTAEQTISWIFLSIAVSSEINPADFIVISMIADGINHAVPNHKELQASISWLMGKGLVLKHSKKYELSEKGKSEFERVSGKNIGYLKMMEEIELNFKILA
jgi:predicted transcriptional regulator